MDHHGGPDGAALTRPGSDFVLARRLHALGRRPPVSGWNELVDALHASGPLSRAAVLVLCDLECDAETRRIDVILLLRGTGGRAAERKLITYLGDSAPRVVRAAVHALGACGTHRATEALAVLSATHDGAARRALARIHARLGEVRGALSEGTPTGDGGVSVVRRREHGRLSEPE